MANVIDVLDELQNRALKEPELKERLKNTKKEKEPLSAFCRVCQERGYEIYEMDIICAGEEFHAAMKRSTNGGGRKFTNACRRR